MNRKKEIVDLVLGEFYDLVTCWGFDPPRINQEGWMTRIDYFKGGIAFEVELDIRESELFAFLVRLDGGHLPGGYYIYRGRICRKHLDRVIREQGWSKFRPPDGASKNIGEFVNIEYSVAKAKYDLFENIEKIIDTGDALF